MYIIKDIKDIKNFIKFCYENTIIILVIIVTIIASIIPISEVITVIKYNDNINCLNNENIVNIKPKLWMYSRIILTFVNIIYVINIYIDYSYEKYLIAKDRVSEIHDNNKYNICMVFLLIAFLISGIILNETGRTIMLDCKEIVPQEFNMQLKISLFISIITIGYL